MLKNDIGKSRYMAIFQALEEGIILINRKNRIVLANDCASKMVPWAVPLDGRDITEVFSSSTLERGLQKAVENSSRTAIKVTCWKGRTGDKAIVKGKGREKMYSLSITAIDEKYTLISVKDITEIERLSHVRQDFVSNVSHELRTPLTSLQAYIEALNEGAWKDPGIAPKFLEVTQQETSRMIRMINDLLSLSRMDRGVSKMDLEFVNLNDFVNHILNRFDMIVKTDKNKEKKKYTIKRELGSQALWVEIDTDKMMQVIDNIMNNAIKYSPDGGVITVRMTQNQNHVILSISDQGLGIPRKDLGKIFDRFYRVDKARSRAQGGTGLGLAIAKEIVEAHHGRIWADSNEGKGSTFYISLPYKPMTEEDDWDEV